ncbi:MAG: peptidylprolyl isomerase [Candidatus Methylopumilus sp.]
MSNMQNTSILKQAFALLITLFLLGSLALTEQAKSAEIVKMDRIVAIVDQVVITENELADRVKTVTAQLEKQGTELPPPEILEKQILERMINDRLQLQFAAQTGLKIDDNQLDKTIERIAEQNKMDIPSFKKALLDDGIQYRKFREDIRNEITLARLREREVDNRINITESEIDSFIAMQAASNSSDEFEISHILIRAGEDTKPEDLKKLRAKAEDALAQLQAGKDFAKISASFSDAPNALEGGSLGWKNGSQIPALFLEALKPLKAGELSPILRSPNGFHILKVTNRRGGTSPLVISQTHVRHILIKLSEIVSEKDAMARMVSIKERLDHGDKFEDLARQFSDDGSAKSGGDLSWVNPGDTVPEFEKAMNALAPGETSGIIKTQFGLHILQVIERRNQDMSKEAARIKARQEIRARKSDEAYQDWVRELRDRAFVELRLEDKY